MYETTLGEGRLGGREGRVASAIAATAADVPQASEVAPMALP